MADQLGLAHTAATTALARYATTTPPGLIHADPGQAAAVAIHAALPIVRAQAIREVGDPPGALDWLSHLGIAGELAILSALGLITDGRAFVLVGAYVGWRIGTRLLADTIAVLRRHRATHRLRQLADAPTAPLHAGTPATPAEPT